MSEQKPHDAAGHHDIFAGSERDQFIRMTMAMERLTNVTEANTFQVEELKKEIRDLKDGRIATLTLSNGTMEVRVRSLEKLTHGALALLAVELVSGVVGLVVWAIQRG